MNHANLEKMKERYGNLNELSTIRSMYENTKLCTLYNLLFLDSGKRLSNIANRLCKLFADLDEEKVKTEMTVLDVMNKFREFDYEHHNQISREQYSLILSVIYDIIFVPFKIGTMM